MNVAFSFVAGDQLLCYFVSVRLRVVVLSWRNIGTYSVFQRSRGAEATSVE
jgi:hypothetical protein